MCVCVCVWVGGVTYYCNVYANNQSEKGVWVGVVCEAGWCVGWDGVWNGVMCGTG